MNHAESLPVLTLEEYHGAPNLWPTRSFARNAGVNAMTSHFDLSFGSVLSSEVPGKGVMSDRFEYTIPNCALGTWRNTGATCPLPPYINQAKI
jgi:hypothetical protein